LGFIFSSIGAALAVEDIAAAGGGASHARTQLGIVDRLTGAGVQRNDDKCIRVDRIDVRDKRLRRKNYNRGGLTI
jgi:hypothetical protein